MSHSSSFANSDNRQGQNDKKKSWSTLNSLSVNSEIEQVVLVLLLVSCSRSLVTSASR